MKRNCVHFFAAIFIPFPLFLTLSGSSQGVTLCGAAPLGLSDGGRLEAFMTRLGHSLGEDGRETS